jgi:hypothetical protein
MFAALVIAVSSIAVLTVAPAATSNAFARPLGRPSVKAHSTFPWKGHDRSCRVFLPGTGIPSYAEFTTCPPKRVLLIGDSIALTMGIEMSLGQENWGTLIDNQSLTGCGFVTGDSVDYMGSFTAMDPHCDDEGTVWAADARSFKPQAILIEMGWWDSYQHLIDGKVVALGQPSYDATVKQQMEVELRGLRSVSAAPIYLLSVPWMDPPALPNGQPEPAASVASHNEINHLLRAATQYSKAVHFVDVSPYITPSGRYQTDADGGVCRASWDGVHLYYGPQGAVDDYVQTDCGKALQKGILSMIREYLAKK